MFGLGKKKPVAENEADGEIERVYHEIRQTLRVTGVNLNFRTWAGYGNVLPVLWDAMRPNAETYAFEEAADHVRAEAARSALALGPLGAQSQVRLGESQAYQLRGALDLYHYINPKLLVFTSAILLAIDSKLPGRSPGHSGTSRIPRGAPQQMQPMEMEDESPDDLMLQKVFDDIKATLELNSINSDYRTLALWPEYLDAAWGQLKPVTKQKAYREATDRIRQAARDRAAQLPHPVSITRADIEDVGEKYDEVVEVTQHFEQLLPGLILNVALFELDWHDADDLLRSPYPLPQLSPAGVQ